MYLAGRITKELREEIVVECLELLAVYFGGQGGRNEVCERDVGYVCEIVAILENSKNSFGCAVQRGIEQLNRVLFRGVGGPVQGQFWNFCTRTFDELLRRRTDRPLSLEKLPDIYIEPTKRIKAER